MRSIYPLFERQKSILELSTADKGGTPVLAFVARFLPLGLGIENLRMIFLEDATLSLLWQNGLLPGLIINTLAYVLVGLALFTWGERRARRNGTLAHY
jgi:hypothetical protein